MYSKTIVFQLHCLEWYCLVLMSDIMNTGSEIGKVYNTAVSLFHFYKINFQALQSEILDNFYSSIR